MPNDRQQFSESSSLPRDTDGLFANVRWGATWGWRTGLLFCVWVLVLIVLNGSLTLRMHDGHTANALAVFALYFLGGPMAGAIVGALRPLSGSLLGALVVGYIAALPVCFGGVFVVRGFVSWDMESTIMLLVGSLLGPWVAFLVRRMGEGR